MKKKSHVLKRNTFKKFKLVVTIIIFGLLIVVFFLGYFVKNGVIYKNKFTLEQRFNKYVALLENKNYNELYNFYSTEYRHKISREQFVKNSRNQGPLGKQQVTINTVTLNGDVGYIDRTNVYCQDSSCKNKTTIRGYKKWVFENGNWYYSSEDPYCIRATPYDVTNEIKNALEQIKYKSSLDYGPVSSYVENCLDIIPAAGKNGIEPFVFAKENSSPDKLVILADPSVHISNDALRAFLLIPAIAKARQDVFRQTSGATTACETDQVGAIFDQALFITGLEVNDYTAMLQAATDERVRATITNISTFSADGTRTCKTGSWRSFCYSNYMTQRISDMVEKDPYYQEKCQSSVN